MQSVDLDSLTPAQKQRVWHYIKSTYPALAITLASPGFTQAKTTFGARILMDEKVVNAALTGHAE